MSTGVHEVVTPADLGLNWDDPDVAHLFCEGSTVALCGWEVEHLPTPPASKGCEECMRVARSRGMDFRPR